MKLKEYVQEQMADPTFRTAYEKLAPEHELIKALIAARAEKNLTQKDLAARTGIQQAHISRLESGNGNPSLKFLKRVAAGLGKELHITLR